MKLKSFFCMVLMLALGISCLSGCGAGKETVVIYTSMEDYRVEYLNSRLAEQFPEYNIIVEYMPTGNQAARLLAEGTVSECDIIHNLEYGYLRQLDAAGLLEDLSAYDKSIYTEDTYAGENIIPQERNSGCIILNPRLLEELGLPIPSSYEDLLRPEYQGLISMPSPKASGTGYMFLKSLINAWGEEAAFAYFDRLTPNILQYTSSGSGPLNAVLLGEAAIGLGMTAPAVTQINEGQNIELMFFEEGAPYSLYGQGVLQGKLERPAVREVFDFLVHTFNYENCEKFFPEKIYKDQIYVVTNYPNDIAYGDMSGNTVEEKIRLLEMWKY